MRLLVRLLEPRATVHAHCDLPCGVYDPLQGLVEHSQRFSHCRGVLVTRVRRVERDRGVRIGGLQALEHLFLAHLQVSRQLGHGGRPAEPLGEIADGLGQRQLEFLQPPRDPDSPPLVAEMPLYLSDNGRRRICGELDLSRGVEFSTYATPTIVGEIKRHFRDKGWAVRVPRRLQELKLALTKAISDLAQRLGRAPTVAELAAHLQMSEEEVLEGLESANAYSTVSLDAPDSGDEDAPAVAESLGMLDEALEGVEYRESLKPLLERLPPREKRILMLRFFGNMTQSQIATELGISQMHVSRLLARTLTQLREGLTTDE